MDTVKMLPIEVIHADWDMNPRRKPTESELRAFGAEILRDGQQQNITVSPRGDGKSYMVTSGYRRYEAMKLAGAASILARIDASAADPKVSYRLAVVENEQRKNLSTYESAVSYKRLCDDGMKVKEVADLVGRAAPTVSNLLSALKAGETGVMIPALFEIWKGQGPEPEVGKAFLPMSALIGVSKMTEQEQVELVTGSVKPPSRNAVDNKGPGRGKGKRSGPSGEAAQEAAGQLVLLAEPLGVGYVVGASLALSGYLAGKKDRRGANAILQRLTETFADVKSAGGAAILDGAKAAQAWLAGGGGKKRVWKCEKHEIYPVLESEDADGGEGDEE